MTHNAPKPGAGDAGPRECCDAPNEIKGSKARIPCSFVIRVHLMKAKIEERERRKIRLH
jgi:hypothetical protein